MNWYDFFMRGPSVFLFAAFLLASTLPASAHTDGLSQEQENGRYHIELGIDAKELRPGMIAMVHTDVLEQGSGSLWAGAEFDSVRFVITAPDGSVTEQSVPRVVSITPQFPYRFPVSGTYTVDLEFTQKSAFVTSATFELHVPSAWDRFMERFPWVWVISGVILAALMALFRASRRPK